MIAYKLFRVRRDGSLGSLFINKSAILPMNKWIVAEDHKTKGYKHRPGWHCLPNPVAPHLSMNGRKWFKVEIKNMSKEVRPVKQGGTWFLARNMRILSEVQQDEACV